MREWAQAVLTASSLHPMRQKAVKTADELRTGLKPGGNETFSHSSPGKFEIDIRRRSCHQRGGFNRGHSKTPIERSYELEKIFHRFLRRFCLPLHVWLYLVRDVDARCASRSANASATRG